MGSTVKINESPKTTDTSASWPSASVRDKTTITAAVAAGIATTVAQKKNECSGGGDARTTAAVIGAGGRSRGSST